MKEVNKNNFDESINLKDDFYSYAVGGWQMKNPLKDDYSRFGTFEELREKSRDQLKELITTLSEHPDSKIKGTIAQKIADLYAMGMDEKRLNEEGAAPLQPFIEDILNQDYTNLAKTLAWYNNIFSSSFFGVGVGPDYLDSNVNKLHIGEGGLGLGDRDYYLIENETNKKIMDAYKEYLFKIMTLAGYAEEDARRVRDTVIEIEHEMAKNAKSREEYRNPVELYNPATLDELVEKYPDFDWQAYFEEIGLDVKNVNVVSPKFTSFILKYLNSLTEQQIKDFLVCDFISQSTGVLSDEFGEASFELYGKVMSGMLERKPRWKRAMTIPNSMFGEAVGKLYVEKYFPEANKQEMKKLVENLRIALSKHIDNLTWMSDETKAKAQEKLKSMGVKIGYPDKFKEYDELDINPELSYMENVLLASRWFIQYNHSKLHKPVDKDEWHMTPQTVNAYYSPINNEICFPAAILQPPYFDMNALPAVNYGAIGVVIGHEMTHGFDDQGRQFDNNGNLVNWWKDEDADKFNALAEKLVEQFNKVEVAPGVFANGKFTLGENIADQGGLRIAYSALEEAVSPDKISKNDAQQFYLSYAGVWAENIREEEILSRNVSDPHSLGRNRVNVTVKNLSTFFDAFDIKDGDKMFKPEKERVIIW